MRAIRLNAKGDITPSETGGTNDFIAWEKKKGNYMQTPIIVGNSLYACFDAGIVSCFDAKTGEERYSERMGNGSEGFTASPVSDGRNLYFTSEIGNVYVVPANGTFSITATNSLGETCLSTAALDHGTLFYRTRSALLAIGAGAVN